MWYTMAWRCSDDANNDIFIQMTSTVPGRRRNITRSDIIRREKLTVSFLQDVCLPSSVQVRESHQSGKLARTVLSRNGAYGSPRFPDDMVNYCNAWLHTNATLKLHDPLKHDPVSSWSCLLHNHLADEIEFHVSARTMRIPLDQVRKRGVPAIKVAILEQKFLWEAERDELVTNFPIQWHKR